jgi:hypothetical protein
MVSNLQHKSRRRALFICCTITAFLLLDSYAVDRAEEIAVQPVEPAEERIDEVLKMNPAGFWPVNEGEGDIIHDLSVHANHGRNRHVEWDKERSLPHFAGRYQWLEIPKHKAYQSEAFSLGGWLFIRSEVIGGGWVNRQGMQLIGNRSTWGNPAGLQLCIRKQEVIDVVSSGKEDVLGTRLYVSYKDGKRLEQAFGKPNLELGRWHHLLYTFEDGRGSLYHNATLIASEEGIAYSPSDSDLLIGNDAEWWHQQAGKSGSLDGSVRNMVWFDRALTEDEVMNLTQRTRPGTLPRIYDESMVVLNGRPVTMNDLPDLDSATCRMALKLYLEKPKKTVQELSGPLLPVLEKKLSIPTCRLPAAQILEKIDSDAARTLLKAALPDLLQTIQNKTLPESERAEAVLVLRSMKQDATPAVPVLLKTLETLLDQEGVSVPRVEDLLRNALLQTLWDHSPREAQTDKLLGVALAKPLLEMADYSRPEFVDVKAQINRSDFIGALESLRKLKPSTLGEGFFSFKAPGKEGDYTATARYKGSTYKVGEGIAWRGVEKISPAAYAATVARLSTDYPAASHWHKPDYEHLYRIPITKIWPSGKEQTVYLEGEDFILDGSDAKCRAWSIFVDELGYIHLIGGQHNTPNPDQYIPGSWEKMGISRIKNSATFPRQMYWVSTQPEKIDSFKFVGQRNNSRAIPADYLNYMNLLQGPDNKTYLYGRVDGCGWQSWGMFRYDARLKKWNHVGDDPCHIMQSALRRDPHWENYLHDQIRGAYPKTPGNTRCLVWAWQPAFYNFCRDNWGARFDKTGRLHIHMGISGLDGYGHNRFTSVYAWSDDNGKTFHRADGSPVQLPLTTNPAPEHNAELNAEANAPWWDVWLELMKKAGYQ